MDDVVLTSCNTRNRIWTWFLTVWSKNCSINIIIQPWDMTASDLHSDSAQSEPRIDSAKRVFGTDGWISHFVTPKRPRQTETNRQKWDSVKTRFGRSPTEKRGERDEETQFALHPANFLSFCLSGIASLSLSSLLRAYRVILLREVPGKVKYLILQNPYHSTCKRSLVRYTFFCFLFALLAFCWSKAT